MSLIRQDPTTKEWVILATERAKRPHEFRRPSGFRDGQTRSASCPFCPGNEGSTPGEVFRIPDETSAGWGVRVIPNKYAAVGAAGEPERREIGPLFREMRGVGFHEVIIESPVHNRFISAMSDAEVERILLAYRARYRVLREDPRVRYIIIFKNHGTGAGTSLEHPHSQLVAVPVAPMQIRRKYEVAVGHYDDTGRCLYCDLAGEERRAKVRMVSETPRFWVFHPYASRLPFETWIGPKRHQPSFGALSDDEIGELASVLRRTLGTIYEALGDPDFNYILQTAPVEAENNPYYLWHIQILPRLAMIAGFELGSGISISTVLPEASAEFIRDFRPEAIGREDPRAG